MERWERPLSPQPMYRAPEVEPLPLSLHSGHVFFFLLLHVPPPLRYLAVSHFSPFWTFSPLALFWMRSHFSCCLLKLFLCNLLFSLSFLHLSLSGFLRSYPTSLPKEIRPPSSSLTPPPPLPALFSMIPVSLHDWYRPYHPQHLETFLLNIIHMVIHVLKKRTVCVCWLLVCICSTCYMYSTELQQWKLDWENEESIMKHQLEVLCLNKCPHWLKSRSDRPCTSASAQCLLLIRLIWPLCLTAIMTEYLQLFLTHKAVLFISRNIPYDSINEGTRVELLHLDLLWVHQT